MDWKAQKRACDRAAMSDADRDENCRDNWTARGLQERYDKQYKERRAQIEADEAKQARLSPLEEIERAADSLTYSDNSDTRNLARLIQKIAEHLIEKESGL